MDEERKTQKDPTLQNQAMEGMKARNTHEKMRSSMGKLCTDAATSNCRDVRSGVPQDVLFRDHDSMSKVQTPPTWPPWGPDLHVGTGMTALLGGHLTVRFSLVLFGDNSLWDHGNLKSVLSRICPNWRSITRLSVCHKGEKTALICQYGRLRR